MTNFGGWGTPQGGFNWNMLTNVGAGMLANSQYSPGQAFGKGYEQAQANSLEQAKTGLLYQDYDMKKKHQQRLDEAMSKLPELLGIGKQAPPAAGSNLGMMPPTQAGTVLNGGDAPTHEVPMLQAPQAQGGMGAAPGGGGGGVPSFDTETYNKLGNVAAYYEGIQVPEVAAAARQKMSVMKTLYDQQMAQADLANKGGQLEVARGGLRNQQRQTDLTEQQNKFDQSGGKEYNKLFMDTQNSRISARSKINTIDQMDKDMQAKGFYSGAGGYSALQLKRIAKALNLPGSEGVESMEQFNALQAQSVLDGANGSLGNQISNGDREKINDTVMQLGNTPEGNRAIGEFKRKLALRDIEVGKWAQEYAKAHNDKLDSGWYDFLDNKVNGSSIFGAEMGPPKPEGLPTSVPASGVSGGGDTTPKPSAAPDLHYDIKTGKISRVTPAAPAPAEYPAPGTQWPPMMPPAQPAAAGAQPGWMQKMFGGQ